MCIRDRNVIAIVAEIVGIIILIGPLGAQVSAGGIILTLLSVLTFSLYGVMGKKKCMQYGGVTVTCLSFLFGAAELFVVVLLSHIGGVADYMTAHGMETYANIPLDVYKRQRLAFVSSRPSFSSIKVCTSYIMYSIK